MDKLLDHNNDASLDESKEPGHAPADKGPFSLRFGIGKWRPDCLQRFNNPTWFIICISVFSACQAIVVNGFIVATISTIEKEFGFSSTQSGIIMAANDVAGLIFVPVISFFCSKQKPKWIALGSMLCGVGALLFAVPKLVVGAYEPTVIKGGMSSLVTCMLRTNSSLQAPLPSYCESKTFSVETISLLVFIVAQIVMGIGTAPLYTLGPAYIDENVDPKTSPIFLGIWFATTFLGPGLGLVLGGSFLNIYVDIKQPKGVDIGLLDTQWIGAWWLSFFSMAWVLLLTAGLLICYPESIKQSSKKRLDAIKAGHLPKEDKSVELSIRGMVRATVNLIKNTTFIFTVLGFTVRTIYGVGMGAFFVKLIIIKFGLLPDKAGIILGAVIIPGMTIGIMIGAFIMRRVSLLSSNRKATFICMVCSILGIFTTGMFLIPGCQDSNLAGIEQPYHNSTYNGINLMADCNVRCACPKAMFLPLCGSDGVTYFSPCHAGCTGLLGRMEFGNCSCIPPAGSAALAPGPTLAVTTGRSYNTTARPPNSTFAPATTLSFTQSSVPPPTASAGSGRMRQPRQSPHMGQARVGFCDRKCKNLTLFLALMIFTILITFISGTPNKMIVLRSVPDNQRAYALGIQFMLLRGLSFIPGPIIAGTILDGCCKMWGVDSCGKRTNCLDYKIDQMSFSLAAFGCITAAAATVCYFIAWYFCKTPTELDFGEKSNGLMEVNKEVEDSNANTAL